MARKKKRRSDFKQIWISNNLVDGIDLGKTINYKFGRDCSKFLDNFFGFNFGFNYTKGSKMDIYKHDRNLEF